MTEQAEREQVAELTGVDGFRFAVGDGPITIGRDPTCQIVLDDNQASRCHARLCRVDDGYEVRDLDSMNGTLVNGLPIESQHLYHGDTLLVGGTRFVARGFPERPAEVALENAALVQRLAEEKAALHQAHEDLKAAHEVLVKSEKLAVVGLLSSGIVHELKNPIAAIALSNDVLAGQLRPKEGGSVPVESIHELSTNIAEGVAQCRRVMDRLLMYTRDHEADRTATCVRSLVEEMVSFLEYEIRRAGATVTCRFADDLVPVHMTPNHIKQALVNITLNALQAMKPHAGRLEIAVDVLPRDGGLPEIRIRFRDNGRGMGADECRRIFEPFYRGPAHPVGTIRTGLGMSVSQGIVKQHGGRIRVDSTPDQGTTVDVLFPAATPAPVGADDLAVTQRIPLSIASAP